VTRWPVIATVVLVTALVAWFVAQEKCDSGPGQLHAASERSPSADDPLTPPKEPAHPSLREMIALGALLLVGVGGLVLISHLHRRRQKAVKEARKRQKEQAFSAERTQRDTDQPQ